MKKLIVVIVAAALLSGCAALEIADMIIDDDCIYRGTIVSVEYGAGRTIVTFGGGYTAECESDDGVRPGDWAQQRATPDGCNFTW